MGTGTGKWCHWTETRHTARVLWHHGIFDETLSIVWHVPAGWMLVVMQYKETSIFSWRDLPPFSLGHTSTFMLDIPFLLLWFSGIIFRKDFKWHADVLWKNPRWKTPLSFVSRSSLVLLYHPWGHRPTSGSKPLAESASVQRRRKSWEQVFWTMRL